MIEIFIHSLEIMLVGLTGYLAFTIYSLSSSKQSDDQYDVQTHRSVMAYSRVESITSAQIFTGLQLLEVRREGIDPVSIKEDWLDRSISFFLLGAIKTISEHFECSHHDRNDVMQYLLTKNLKLSEAQALSYISDVDFVADETIEKSAMGAGVLAARTWLTHKFIPEDQSLFNNLQNWGFIA